MSTEKRPFGHLRELAPELSAFGNYPETGFEETRPRVPEADFWPGITSGLPDTRPQSRASEHGHSSNFDKPKSQHSLDESAYIVLLYCLASHPIRVERISS